MRDLKLLININILSNPLTGIGYYTLNILKELLARDIDIVGIKNGKLLLQEDIQALIASVSSSTKEQQFATKSKLRHAIINFLRAVPGMYKLKFWLQSWKIRKILSDLADQGYVYFEPCFVPFEYKGKVITTIHDLSFIIHPEFHPASRVRYLTKQLEQTVVVSTKIVVDSQAILEELNQLYPQAKTKYSVLYLGVSEAFRAYSKDETDPVLTKLNLTYKGFLLSVATLEPRKNLRRLVEAYKQLPQNIRQVYPLVLVGGQGWKNNEFYREVDNSFEQQVIVTGYLSDQELYMLYAAAKMFIYPSLYEGFGLPIIEAMASNTVVVTSNYGAMAEVAQDAALLVDPLSSQAITQGIEQLLDNPTLSNKLIEKGKQRVKSFSWSTTVDNLLNLANKEI